MITIQTRLNGHELILVNAPELASDSVEFDRVHFDFDDSWDGYSATALFWGTDSDEPYASIVDVEGYAIIPSEVLSEKSTIRFGVYGVDSNELLPRVTSTIVKYKIKEGAWSDAISNVGEATESMVEQLQIIAYAALARAGTLAQNALDIATQVQEDLEEARSAAESAQSASEAAQAAAQVTSEQSIAAASSAAASLSSLNTIGNELKARTDAVEESIATVVASGDPFASKTLFSESSSQKMNATGDTVTIDEDFSEYDYLDFYLICGAETDIKRVTPASSFVLTGSSNGETAQKSFSAELAILEDTITLSHLYYISPAADGSTHAHGEITDGSENTDYRIIKIIGWKIKDSANADDYETKDTELIDIRTDSNGRNYSSAGASVRGQVGGLRSDLESFKNDIEVNDALFEGFSKSDFGWTVGWIVASSGELRPNQATNDNWTIYSDLIPCNGTITINVTNGYRYRYHYWNKETGAYIGSINNATPPNTVTLNDTSRAYRVMLYPAEGATQADAQNAIRNISDYLTITSSVPAPITAERLDDIGMATQADIDALDRMSGLKKITFTSGGYIPLDGTTADYLNPTPNNAWRYAVVDCAESDLFMIDVLGSSGVRAYGFIDNDNAILLGATGSNRPIKGVVRAPKDAVRLIINDKSSPKTDSYYGVKTDLAIKRLANATEKPDWYVGFVVSGSGEPRYGQSNNGVYQLFTDFITYDSDVKFASPAHAARWFRYNKETLAFIDNSGSFLPAPVSTTLTSDYIYRLVIEAGTTLEKAEELRDNIYDYVMVEGRKPYDAVINYGATWDWWITPASVDGYGNAYIGYIDTDGYVGVLRRQPDGVMQYRRLESSYNDDDHNGAATIVLDDGRILVMASHGHSTDNHIICWRSLAPHSIDYMERLSFDIPQPGTVTYKTSYMQLFKYNGTLFGFLRVNSKDGDASSITGFGCLISADNGSTWTAYKALNGVGGYQAMTHAADNAKYMKVVCGINPSDGANNFAGCYIDLSTYKVYDLSDNEIGQMVPLDGSSIEDSRCAKKTSMTDLGSQSTSSQIGRLFYGCPTPLAQTVFCFARADDSTNQDFTYMVYNNGTLIEIGKSGIPFGNTHYISGMCFGIDESTIYYAKATTSVADGNHELHKVKLANNAVESDVVICEAPLCLLRPLFVGNGEVAVTLGKYNSLNGGSGNEFTQWTLKPKFVQA